MSTPENLPGQGGDFVKGASGPPTVYDNSPAGLGLSPSYLSQGAAASASAVSGSNAQLSYTEFTASVTINATTEATANTIVTAPSLTFDGTTNVIVEFSAPQWVSPAVVSDSFLVLYEDGASLGLIAVAHNAAAADVLSVPVHRAKQIAPAAAAHVFSVRGYVSSGSGRIDGGLGGAGNYNPGFIRIVKI